MIDTNGRKLNSSVGIVAWLWAGQWRTHG